VRILENLIWRTLRILFEESKPGAKAAGDEDNSLIFKLLGRVALKVILLVVLGLGVLATGLSLLVLKLLF
jgi:hypothetical protein